MKVIYMGTPEFAVPALEQLYNNGYEIPIVVTQPDKARDRGKKIQFPAVKQKALELGIRVLQPEKVKGDTAFISQIKEFEPDLIVVAAYGKILPKSILDIPKYGCVNIHASLLPKYRGAAPIHWSIIEGEEETGVTLMYMEEGLDTGDMIASSKTKIDKKTTSVLHDELAEMGARLLIDTIPSIENGTAKRIKQDDSKSTYAPMIFKKDGIIDYSKNPIEIERLVRGLNSWPGAYTIYNDKTMKIWEAEAKEKESSEKDGTILNVSDKGIEVAAGGKILLIKKIQMPGKKSMPVADYLKGNKIDIKTILG
ncbi:methionyl-tRNA formyltransferase [Anaerovorax odorimutans]|uniref:methionyl-tRNA formyltransferase n=1 Tax=Anaerovorax odorimutans TaxID=109327 RepID=UPI00041083A1|nr:methionyl-tRNA formyltransferase [Anaerovorax odorimutans]